MSIHVWNSEFREDQTKSYRSCRALSISLYVRFSQFLFQFRFVVPTSIDRQTRRLYKQQRASESFSETGSAKQHLPCWCARARHEKRVSVKMFRSAGQHVSSRRSAVALMATQDGPPLLRRSPRVSVSRCTPTPWRSAQRCILRLKIRSTKSTHILEIL